MIIHMIGNAHLDPVWLWPWPEGCAEAIGTCWAAIDRLDEHQGFVFTRGEAQVYAWIEELEPRLLERIKHYVQEGRWHITNGWWIQPDCNLPSGEAFIRQALYGQSYFHRVFGDLPFRTAYNVDSFGHAATLPMILRHTGYNRYVFMRPMEHEKDLPGPLFNWQAPDGSKVLTYRIPKAYTTNARYPVDEAIRVHQKLMDKVGHDLMCFYGVGNHGGGPTRANLETIDAAIQNDVPLEYSQPDRYFDAVEAEKVPTVADELQYHAIGCYSVVAPLKALSRRAEARLAVAEAAAALATFGAKTPYPRDRLHSLWQTLLFNQFHDILGGTSVPSATEDAVQALSGVVQGADEVLYLSVRHLAAQVSPTAPGPGAAFLVFNFSGYTQTVPVEYEPWLVWDDQTPYQLQDHQGQTVPHQELPPESFTKGMRRILFHADLPAYGYCLYRFVPTSQGEADRATTGLDPHYLQTKRWLLEIDSSTGAIARLHDRRNERDVFAGGANEAIVVDDTTDTWSHGVDRFPLQGELFSLEEAKLLETGPLRYHVQVTSRYGASTLQCDYLLYERDDQPLEIRVTLNWQEKHQLLRLRYPLALAQPEFRYEIPYGSVVRSADGREWPGQSWVLARASGYGVVIANDAKYSYAAREDELFLTAARSPAMAHHDPAVLADRLDTPSYADQGQQRFTIRIAVGVGVGAVDAQKLANGLLRSPVVTPHVARTGKQAQSSSLLDITAASTVPTWLKLAEDNDDLVLRVLEVEGKEDNVIVSNHEAFSIGPYKLMTLRLHDSKVVPCNGLEHE